MEQRQNYISVGICDDDGKDLESLKQMLDEIFIEEKIKGKIRGYTKSEDLFEDLQQNPNIFTVLILDVIIDDMTGIHLAQYLRQVNGKASIIFVTRYPEFSLQGYYVSAARFLLKPVEKERLKEAVCSLIGKEEEQFALTMKTDLGEVSLSPQEILYIELYGRKSKVYTMEKVFEIRENFSQLCIRLPSDCFARCHKSFFVNVKHIAGIQRYSISFANKKSIPISKNQYDEIRSLLLQTCFEQR